MKCKAYLDFIRAKPCLICGQRAEAAHNDGGGMAIKTSDLTAIPLCHKHHIDGEHKGFKSFWAKMPYDRLHYQMIYLTLFIDYIQEFWPKDKCAAFLKELKCWEKTVLTEPTKPRKRKCQQ